jgi:hypothetical protein
LDSSNPFGSNSSGAFSAKITVPSSPTIIQGRHRHLTRREPNDRRENT